MPKPKVQLLEGPIVEEPLPLLISSHRPVCGWGKKNYLMLFKISHTKTYLNF